MDAANSVLKQQQYDNILLKDMFDSGAQYKKLQFDDKNRNFFKDKDFLSGLYVFFKYNLFESFINDTFSIAIFFISKICFLILKIVYSMVYYLGLGLIGIPCLLYIFPGMGQVLRGGIISFLWLLIVPVIVVAATGLFFYYFRADAKSIIKNFKQV